MKNIPGYITNSELVALKEIFEKYNTKESVGIEIGSLHGKSSHQIATSVPDATLYCIDGWDGYDSSNKNVSNEVADSNGWPRRGTLCTIEFFKENVKECNNIIPIKGHSPQCVLHWTLPVDFVFLDALHLNPSDWDNISFWLPKIKKGGRFAGHDYYANRRQWPDVHDNVKALEQQLGQPVVNPPGTSIWYFDVL
jgi:hypothetical protein